MNSPNLKTYPNIAQSIGIVGIMILAQIIFSPIVISRSLTLSMVIHATVNLTGFVMRLVMDKDKMAEDSTWSEILGGFGTAFLIATAGILIAAFCIYQLNKEFESFLQKRNN
ncbi:MAG: hypothetical protein ACERKD_02855 [Prolixibacteraceae bacterium]